MVARNSPPEAIHVLHISSSDARGGAFRAAQRVHRSLAELPEGDAIRSSMLVKQKRTDDPSVHTIEKSRIGRLSARIAAEAAAQDRLFLRTKNSTALSTARVPTTALRRMEHLKPDVVVLHWLGNRTMSIRQLGRLLNGGRPIVWMFHDSWAFCGAEHHPHWEGDSRFVDGYTRNNRLEAERGPDINRWAWQRKRRYWTHPAHLVAPSRWMAELANRSALMGSWPTEVIPYPLDTYWWGALSRSEARARLGLPLGQQIVLFGAERGEQNPIKGADLLRRALPRVVERMLSMGRAVPELLTFGGPPGVEHVAGMTVRSVGRLDDEGLRLHYSAADVMVVPSRQDNFPQTAVESTACGTPVVAFAVGGLLDIVEDGVTGRLAQPFDIEQLAEAIVWILCDSERHARLSATARMSASRWDQQMIGGRYLELLRHLTSKKP